MRTQTCVCVCVHREGVRHSWNPICTPGVLFIPKFSSYFQACFTYMAFVAEEMLPLDTFLSKILVMFSCFRVLSDFKGVYDVDIIVTLGVCRVSCLSLPSFIQMWADRGLPSDPRNSRHSVLVPFLLHFFGIFSAYMTLKCGDQIVAAYSSLGRVHRKLYLP